MKILVLCEEGNNRSVHFAHLLKYWNNDVISAGLNTNTYDTLHMLYNWAHMIILVEHLLKDKIPEEFITKVKIFDVGKDIYPRPFNQELHHKVKFFLEQNKAILKND